VDGLRRPAARPKRRNMSDRKGRARRWSRSERIIPSTSDSFVGPRTEIDKRYTIIPITSPGGKAVSMRFFVFFFFSPTVMSRCHEGPGPRGAGRLVLTKPRKHYPSPRSTLGKGPCSAPRERYSLWKLRDEGRISTGIKTYEDIERQSIEPPPAISQDQGRRISTSASRENRECAERL